MDTQRHRSLFNQYLRGTLPPGDLPELRDFLMDNRHTEMVDGWLQEAFTDPALRESNDDRIDASYAALVARIRSEQQVALVIWRPRKPNWLALAAVLVVLLAVGIWLSREWHSAAGSNAITPGGNRATLTLADGRTIDLNEEQSGIVVGDGIKYLDGTDILESRQADGKENLMSDVSYLMSISTPKGGTYQITLSDGSKVWLNAASTLKYPSRFTHDERVVELEGEAYFEVRQQKIANRQETSLKPFNVVSNGQTVQVLGTQFNISAYADEPEIKTTLVEGSVRVIPTAKDPEPLRRQETSTTLAPGEQSTIRGTAIVINTVDTYLYTAWKDNDFVFRNEPLPSVMRQIARWYDVEVNYAKDAPMDLKIGGMVSRYDDIHTLLDIMAETGKVHFEVKNKEITVTR